VFLFNDFCAIASDEIRRVRVVGGAIYAPIGGPSRHVAAQRWTSTVHDDFVIRQRFLLGCLARRAHHARPLATPQQRGR